MTPKPYYQSDDGRASQDCFAGFGVSLSEKTERAIALLRELEPAALKKNQEGYWLAFSGGKDSIVIKRLAIMAGVKFKPVYNVTTIDPPELVRFIRDHHPDVEMNRQNRGFFQAVAERSVPTRLVRWCCEEFKERHGEGYVTVFGVRAAESSRRAKQWREVTPWRNKPDNFAICPIVGWSDDDVWTFIRQERLPYCSLYDEGWTRLGCIGCPMAGKKRKEEFARWPKFEKAWRAACERHWKLRAGKISRSGNPFYVSRFKSGQELFDWWLSDNPTPKEDDQECLGLYDE